MNRTAPRPMPLVALATVFVASLLLVLAGNVRAAPVSLSAGYQTGFAGATPALQRADATLTDLAKKQEFSGAVLVARAGRVLLARGYGMADRKHRVPNTARTQFRIGTSTNEFTAMAILQLQAEGKLHIQDHACAYIPACPKAWRSITLYQLLTHTSGMADFAATSDPSKPSTPAQLLEQAKSTPMIARPGSSWSYSNLGYEDLGYIITKVGRSSYGSFLQSHIFTPARMPDSGYNDSVAKPMRLAVGYSDAYTRSDYIDMSNAFSAAGVYSTVEDLYRWDQALAYGRVASPSILGQMFTSHWILCQRHCPASPGQPEWGYGTPLSTAGYGYGWGIARLRRSNHRLFAAAGGFSSGQSYNGRYPDDGVVIVVLTNQDDVDTAPIVRLLEQAVLGRR